MLGSLILYLKGMRIMMFQLSGFYCNPTIIAKVNFCGLGYSAPETNQTGLNLQGDGHHLRQQPPGSGR